MEKVVPTAFDGGHSFIELHHRFAETKFGKSLAGRTRWEYFRPDYVTSEEWIDLLGADADNLRHTPLMYGLMRQFLRRSEGFSQEESKILLLAAITNDWGEAGDEEAGIPTAGNINFGKKTQSDQLHEQSTHQTVFRHMLGDDQIKLQLIVESTLFTNESRLGVAYDAVRRISYLRTALIAFHRSLATNDEELQSSLQWLTADVLSNQLPKLLQYAQTFPAISEYVGGAKENIDAIFENVTENIFARHGKAERIRIDQYRHVRELWQTDDQASTPRISRSETYDRGIFGEGSNIEARYIDDYSKLKKTIEACKMLGLKVVLTSGSFDMIHVGHARYLEAAKTYGDVLVVGLDSDAKIKQRKGEDRPIVPEDERLQMLTHMRGVDVVTLKQPDDERWKLIKTVRPHTLIATKETYTEAEIEELYDYCERVLVLEPQATTSTSAKIRRLQIGWMNQVIGPIDRILKSKSTPETMRRLIGEVVVNATKKS